MHEIPKNIIIGTVFGGSSLIYPKRGRNCYLSMNSRFPLWLHYKVQELQMYFSNSEITKEGKTYRCRSVCHEDLTNLYQMLYKNNRRFVCEDILNPLRYQALMVWYLDGGGRCGRNKKNIYLNCTLFGEEGTNIIANYFNEMYMTCKISRSKSRIRLIFDVEASHKYAIIIEDAVPLFMINRLYID